MRGRSIRSRISIQIEIWANPRGSKPQRKDVRHDRQTAFDPKAFGKPNPAWTKKRTKVDRDLERLADHICTRTPPHS